MTTLPANYAKQFVANADAGVGLIIQGSSCIYDEGRSSPGMTIVSTREKVLRFAPMVEAVQEAGAAIWLQVGHGGLFSMESWHEPYASNACGPLLVASKPPLALRPIFRRAPLHVMTADEVRAMAVRYGEVAAWAREAGYDGSSSARATPSSSTSSCRRSGTGATTSSAARRRSGPASCA